MIADHLQCLHLLLLLLLACFCQVSDCRERYEAPKITYGPRNLTIATSHHAVFVCKASGNPAPRIDWFLNGMKLDVAKGGYLIFKMPHGSVLRLPNIGTEKDGARIVCVASNPLGNATARANLRIIDEMPAGFPEIIQSGSTIIKQKNDDASLKCKSSGKPPPKTEWYKDYLPINLSDPRYAVKADRLLIRKVLEEDEGVYECMVTNIHGTVSGQVMKVYVRVRRYPPHFLPGMKKKVKVLPGSSANLTCVAAGSPMPQIKWRQGGSLLMPRKSHIGRYTLMLTDIRESGNFTCVATSNLGEVEHTVEVIVKELPKPPSRVYTTMVEAKTVSLRWPYSSSLHVTSYTVVVRQKDDSSKAQGIIQYPNIKPNAKDKQFVHYTLTKLKANTRYEIRVAAVSSIGRSPLSPPVDVKTNELPPGTSPHSINAMALTTRTLKVSWYPPKEQNGEITGYKVYFTQNPRLEVNKWQVLRVNRVSKGSNVKDTANINHLTSNATYYISVSALNSAGEGPISDHFPVKVTPGVPSHPRNFQAITIGPTSIQLAWEPPEGSENPMNSRVLEYILEYKAAGRLRFKRRILSGEIKAFLLEHLNPATDYTIQLTARTKDGRGVKAEAKGRTNEYVPSAPPQNVNAKPNGHNAVLLCWSPPPLDGRNGRIVSYTVRFVRLSESGQPQGPPNTILVSVKTLRSKECTTIAKLHPWTRYRMWVAAATLSGEGKASEPVEATTMESVPTSPIIDRIEVRGSTQLRVFWRRPSEDRGDIKYFTVEVYKTNSTGQTLTKTQNHPRIIQKPVKGNSGQYYTDIKKLTPNTYYRIALRAVTRMGRGDAAYYRPVKTLGEVPSAPTNLLVKVNILSVAKRKMPSLFIKWNQPAVRHGEILQYRVRISIVAPREKIRLMPKPFTQNVSAKGVDNSFSSTSIITYFGVTYEVGITAMNSVDFGDEVKTQATTPDESPSASPMMLVVTDAEPHKVRLSWKVPQLEYQNGQVTQFQVRHFQKSRRDDTELNLNTTLTSITIGNLMMKTYYAFMVRAWTSAGAGPWTNPVVHKTTKYPIPPPPSRISIVRLSETELKVTWKLPKLNTQVKGFRIYYSDRDIPNDPNAWKQEDTGPIFSYTLTNLLPRTSYVVRISTINEKNEVGIWSGPVVARNIPIFTDYTVQGLNCRVISTTKLLLNWRVPRNTNSLKNFQLTVSGRATYVDSDGKLQQHDAEKRIRQILYPTIGSNQRFERPITGLRPNTNYLLSILTVYRPNFVPRETNRRVNTSCETLHDPPGEVRAPIPRTKETRPRLLVGLELRRVSERNGVIQNYYLIVSPVAYANKLSISRMSTDELTKMVDFRGNPSGLMELGANYGNSVSYSRLFAVIPLQSDMIFGKGQSRATFVVGDTRNTRPLEREIDYVAILRACVSRERQPVCRDSVQSTVFGSRREPIGPMGSKPDRNQGLQMVLLVAGPIVIALFLMVCVIVWCFFRRRPKIQRDMRSRIPDPSLKQPLMGSPPPPPYQPMPTDPVEMRRLEYQTPDLLMAARSHADLAAPPEVDVRHCQTLDYRHRRNQGHQPTALNGTITGRKAAIAMMSHPPIPISQFEAHVAACKSNDCMKFSQEYESIDPGQQFTWEHSNLDVNKPKNRYANVIAYDHSRVVLQTIDGVPGSDYVNANYMDGYKKQNAYIASQGPLPETVGDFWRLVWEQRSGTIVMMTRLEERARVKCDLYWPQKGAESYDDYIMVTHMDSLELAYYTIRTFVLQRHGSPEKREVRQFQFTAWPDHGVPDHPTPLLMFMRRVRAANPPDAGPVVVHCSAGVGRTGAFIVIDAMLERIKQEKTVDVYGHVTCLRAQRNYTVQTEDQYIFIHDVLLEAVMCGNTEVPARNLAVHVQKLRQLEVAGRGQVTGMELEFRKIGLKPSNSPFLSANLPPNRLKNRLVNVLPYESTRVTLQPIRGVEGSDYINASFIDGYLSRKAYIATQAPLAETTEDFWRMLWEHNSTIVVMLTKLREMGRDKCHQYWPNARSARYQYFVVDPLSEYNMNNYILREFKVTDARDGQSRTIRQFQYTEWPEQGVPQSGESLIDFIGQVHKTKKQFGQDGPITVHCSAGVGRTGVFLTLAVVLDRMRYEGVADMFQTVKMLRTQRPAMVQTEDQYQFCYACAIEYLNSFDHYSTDVR